jgi:hypothetical protein
MAVNMFKFGVNYAVGMSRMLLVLVGFCLLTGAQEQSYDELLKACAQQEKLAMENPRAFQFTERVQQDWGSETRAVIETPEGRVDRIVAFNDEPLAPDQLKKQHDRLINFLNDRDALRKEVSDQQEEAKRRMRMVATLPEAFLFEYNSRDADGIKFRFSPNPKFSPDTRETQVFKGMQGWIWINPQQQRIVRVQGELFKDVSFGWGILGKLYKGGRFEVVQTQVSPGVWRITTLNLDFHGRVFLFSSLRVLRKEISSGFSATPQGMTLRSGVAQLLSQYPKSTQIRRSEGELAAD